MKKFLLSVMSLMLLAVGANAQNLNNVVKAEVSADLKADYVKAETLNGPKKVADNQFLVGYKGSTGENGLGIAGFQKWVSNNMVLSALDVTDMAEELVGYKLVGLRFAVVGDLGEEVIALTSVGAGEDKLGVVGAKVEDYDVSTLDKTNNQVDIKWNEVTFDQPYEFTGEETELMYGLQYDDPDDDSFLFGVEKESKDYGNMFLVGGVPEKGKQEGIYIISSEKQNYVPLFQMIFENPKGTSVIGIKGSKNAVASKYYTVDGTQISAPQKGLNIVKMSDGTTRKVMVK